MKFSFLGFVVIGIFFFLASGVLPVSALDKGQFKGSVRFDGKIPLPDSGPVKIDPDICGSTFFEDHFLNFQNKGVMNAVISVRKKNDDGQTASSDKRIVLSSRRCHIEPSVTVAERNPAVEIENLDPVLHVLKFSKADQELFTVPLPPNGKVERKVEQPGIIHIHCAIHTFMDSYMVVTDSPNYSLSDGNGEFHFNNLEPGIYQVSIWHKVLGSMEEEIQIESGKALVRSYLLQGH